MTNEHILSKTFTDEFFTENETEIFHEAINLARKDEAESILQWLGDEGWNKCHQKDMWFKELELGKTIRANKGQLYTLYKN